ncbi:MAG: acetoacetate decarboxylase family protein [Aquabacterium sp.]|nr:acetoacetate decarboxylase family protein [Aquabacterium sp.]
MNRRDFGKQLSLLGVGAGAAVAAPAAQATTLPSWLVRAVYNQTMLGVPYGCTGYKQVSLVLPVPPERLALYKSMLPKQLDMPTVPLIYIYAIELTGAFPVPGPAAFEAAVCIRASFKGDRRTDVKSGGWYPLTMPVTSDSALDGGLMMGYPKYKGEIDAQISLTSANAVVKKQGVDQFGLRWSPENRPVPYLSSEDAPFYVIRDGLVNIMETKTRQSNTREQRNGVTTVSCGAQEPWAELIKGMDLQGAGSVLTATGRFDLTRRSW